MKLNGGTTKQYFKYFKKKLRVRKFSISVHVFKIALKVLFAFIKRMKWRINSFYFTAYAGDSTSFLLLKDTTEEVLGLQLVDLNVDAMKILVVHFLTINKLKYKKIFSSHLEMHLSLLTDIPNAIINELKVLKNVLWQLFQQNTNHKTLCNTFQYDRLKKCSC